MVRIGAIALLIAIIFLSCSSPEDQKPSQTSREHAVVDTVVTAITDALWSVDMLKKAMSDVDDLVVVDMRKPEDFSTGHIPGARRIWRDDIQAEGKYGGMMASRGSVEKLLDSLGATPGSRIVVYDARGGCEAARFRWLLDIYGHKEVALLDGGWQAWELSEGEVEMGSGPIASRRGYRFPAEEDHSHYIDMNGVFAIMKDTNAVLVDTRSSEEFTGALLKKGASRAGRIPGAVNYDWGNAVRMDEDWLLKSGKDLLFELESLGITPNKRIVTYCHTGVRSSHTTFVLSELLGFENVQNYDGSWTEWSYLAHLPIETDQKIEP